MGLSTTDEGTSGSSLVPQEPSPAIHRRPSINPFRVCPILETIFSGFAATVSEFGKIDARLANSGVGGAAA